MFDLPAIRHTVMVDRSAFEAPASVKKILLCFSALLAILGNPMWYCIHMFVWWLLTMCLFAQHPVFGYFFSACPDNSHPRLFFFIGRNQTPSPAWISFAIPLTCYLDTVWLFQLMSNSNLCILHSEVTWQLSECWRAEMILWATWLLQNLYCKAFNFSQHTVPHGWYLLTDNWLTLWTNEKKIWFNGTNCIMEGEKDKSKLWREQRGQNN